MKDEQLARTMREIIDMASRTMFKEAECTNEAVNLAKAYADARESKEIAELKAESKYWKDRWEAQNQAHDAEFSSIIAQNAENKRLKDALERVMRHHIDESISILDNYLEMKDIARVAWKASIYPAPVTDGKDVTELPTDDEIHFVAVDESNAERHGWQSLNQKPAYVDGFEDGVKWMRNKKTT